MPFSDAAAVTECQRGRGGRVLQVDLLGRRWRLERVADLESLWDDLGEKDFGDDERLPYWVELWPSSILLSRWLHRHGADIAGRVCIDMGCGLGLTAMVGTSLGARVMALDYEEQALRYARRNAEANKVPGSVWTLMDWRFPGLRQGAADFVWGGDVMYEARFVEPVAAFLEHALAPHGRAWIAEPDRTVYGPFVERMRSVGWNVDKSLTEKVPMEHCRSTVNIWSMVRKGR